MGAGLGYGVTGMGATGHAFGYPGIAGVGLETDAVFHCQCGLVMQGDARQEIRGDVAENLLHGLGAPARLAQVHTVEAAGKPALDAAPLMRFSPCTGEGYEPEVTHRRRRL